MRQVRRVEKSVSFDPTDLDWLDALAKQQRTGRSDIIEAMIREQRESIEGDTVVEMLIEQNKALLASVADLGEKVKRIEQHVRMTRALFGNRVRMDFDGTDPLQLGLERYMTRTRATAEALKHEPEHSGKS